MTVKMMAYINKLLGVHNSSVPLIIMNLFGVDSYRLNLKKSIEIDDLKG